MTSFVSIFSILMVILVNHSTNSGALQKSNLRQNIEARMQRPVAESYIKPAKKGRKLTKKHGETGKKHQKSFRSHKKSAVQDQRKSPRKGQDSAKRNPAEERVGKQAGFEFRACDYLDLVEVGYRERSDFDCKPGDKFVFKV